MGVIPFDTTNFRKIPSVITKRREVDKYWMDWVTTRQTNLYIVMEYNFCFTRGDFRGQIYPDYNEFCYTEQNENEIKETAYSPKYF